MDGKNNGFLDEHSYLVANVKSLSNVNISLQYHFVFDNLFEMVIHQGDNESVIDGIFNELFDLNRDWYEKKYFDDTG